MFIKCMKIQKFNMQLKLVEQTSHIQVTIRTAKYRSFCRLLSVHDRSNAVRTAEVIRSENILPFEWQRLTVRKKVRPFVSTQ